MKALHDLVESGKVRYIGASSMRTWEFATYQFVAEKHGWTKFIAMQGAYSALVSCLRSLIWSGKQLNLRDPTVSRRGA